MAVAFGHICEFELGTELKSAYLERVQLCFVANDVANEKKLAVLLSVIRSKTYVLLRSLLHPEAPNEKTFDQLAKTLNVHQEPKPQTIVERFHFHRRNQEQSKSVLDYIAELRCLSATCDFWGYLKEVLRDRFVCGLSNEATQKRLLTKQMNLDLAKALPGGGSGYGGGAEECATVQRPVGRACEAGPKGQSGCGKTGNTMKERMLSLWQEQSCCQQV